MNCPKCNALFGVAKGVKPSRCPSCGLKFEYIEMQPDMVNSPPHYAKTVNGIECIDAIEAAVTGDDGFKGMLRGNIIKYLWRVGKKDPAKVLEDANKARWYLDRYIKTLEKEMK